MAIDLKLQDNLVTPTQNGEKSQVSKFIHELLHSGTGIFGLIIISFMTLAAVFAPWISPYDPGVINLPDRLLPPLFFGGNTNHIFGTDALGRDLLSRVLYGARVSLWIAVIVVAIAASFGTIVGLLAGFYGKWVDQLIMRIADTQLAFPGILLAIVILYALGPSVTLVIIVLSINGWIVHARMIRGLVLSLRTNDFVEAAELGGARPVRVMLKHILPNLTSTILTLVVLEFARIILAEAALSFLGYGVQPPDASWGLILAEGQNYLSSGWWLVTIPGLMIAITVMSANLFASWLRIYTDPRLRDKQMRRQLDQIVKANQ